MVPSAPPNPICPRATIETCGRIPASAPSDTIPPGCAVFPPKPLYQLDGKGEAILPGLEPTLVYEALVVPTTVHGAATRPSSA